MQPDKLRGMLGLAKRAGRIVIGQDAVLDAVRKGAATPLALSAADASARTVKQLTDKCTTYGVPCRTLPLTSIEFGAALGKEAPISTAAVTDRGFAEAILGLLPDAPGADTQHP